MHPAMLASTRLCSRCLPGPWSPHLVLHLRVLVYPLHSHNVRLQLRRGPHQPVQCLGHLWDRAQRMQSSVGPRNNHLPPQLRDSSWAQASLAWPLTLHSPAAAPSPQSFKSFAAESLVHSRNVLLPTAASIPLTPGCVLPWLHSNSPGEGTPQLIPSPWIRAGGRAASWPGIRKSFH